MSKTKQKPVPATEFPNDPMMRELHERRMKIYKETNTMNYRELIEYFERKSDEFRQLR